MIDIHIHILPGIDDGSPYADVSLEMAEQAVQSGVDRMIMTPHCNIPGTFDNYNDDDSVRKRMKKFKELVKEHEIPLKLYTGMEVFGTPDVPKLLEEGRLLTLNDTKYLLIEFPFGGEPSYVSDILAAICEMGYHPIVAHPERYNYVQADIGLVDYWIRMGCGMQINKGSVLGRFGRGSRRCAMDLLDNGMVSCMASDAHHCEWRTPYMDEARRFLDDYFGEDYARLLTKVNPGRIIEGKELLWPVG